MAYLKLLKDGKVAPYTQHIGYDEYVIDEAIVKVSDAITNGVYEGYVTSSATPLNLRGKFNLPYHYKAKYPNFTSTTGNSITHNTDGTISFTLNANHPVPIFGRVF